MAGVSCTPAPDPIRIAGGTLTVENRSDKEWRSVEIWLNDHYRVTVPSIAPKARFEAPLAGFVAGFGQRFDPRRQSPAGIEVTATEPDGTPVKRVWGTGRRR